MTDLTGAEKFQAIVERLLTEHTIAWCKGCDEVNSSHKRGFVITGERTVHLDRALATRATLFRMLHEIGHIVRDQTGMKRWEREQSANQYGFDQMKAHGISVPRPVRAKANRYVARMKRWGRNIAKGRKQQ